MTSVRTVLVDMDEVLVDFVGGALKVHGWTPERLECERTMGVWDITKAMGLSQEDFWAPINNEGENFWLDLNPLPWMSQVIRLVETWCEHYGGEWHIISSPSRCPSSYTGKVKWLKEEFGGTFSRFALTPHKHIFARPSTVLIDDRPENIRSFRRSGGLTIMFPHAGNELHLLRQYPLPYLQEKLHALNS